MDTFISCTADKRNRFPLTAGYFIYRSTLQKMRELDLNGETSSELGEARDLLEENALLGDFSDFGSDDESTPAASTQPPAGKHLGVRFGQNSTAPSVRRGSGSSDGEMV